ncbi:hypothetical protein, partial [uncultured Marinobacter sp.]|uniref:hypothetical protein n=1 Tax=uncultured Marinobacter sp. TaxID=187379 RepID=UPI00258C9388
ASILITPDSGEGGKAGTDEPDPPPPQPANTAIPDTRTTDRLRYCTGHVFRYQQVYRLYGQSSLTDLYRHIAPA